MFISFSNGNGSAFENSLDSGYPFASVPARCTQTTLLKTWYQRRAETVGLRHDWAIVQCHFRFVRRHWKARRWVVKRRRSYAFSHRGAHFCLRGGWGKREDLTWHPAVKHQTPQRPAVKTTNSNFCDRAVAQHIPEQPGWKNSKYWANIIEKRNQINTKNYWK